MRLRQTGVGVVGLIACLIVGAAVALGAGSSPAGGRIQVFVQPGNGQGNGKILLTGAVGDYGTSHRASTSKGKTMATATLKKGTITFDLTPITKKVNHTNPAPDLATCSASVSVTDTVPIVGGTGLYAGIHGSVKLTEKFGFLGPTIKSGPKAGQCNTGDSGPTLAQMGIVFGNGTVSF